MVNLAMFWKTSNSVTRQVNFYRIKIGEKCQNWKSQMRHFGLHIFKHCVLAEKFNILFKFAKGIFGAKIEMRKCRWVQNSIKNPKRRKKREKRKEFNGKLDWKLRKHWTEMRKGSWIREARSDANLCNFLEIPSILVQEQNV